MIDLNLTEEFLLKVMEYAKAKGLSYGTLKTYASQLRYLFNKYKKLDSDKVLKILNKANHTINRAVINLINEYCLYSKIDFHIILPKKRSTPRKIPNTLTIEEIKMMIEATPKPYDLMLRCIFGIGSGLRAQDIIKLSWNHLYWADWIKNKGDGIVMIKGTKRGKNNINNVPKEIMDSLYEYAKEKDLLNEFFIPEKGVIFDFGIGEWNKSLFYNNKEIWKNQYIKHAYYWIRHNVIKKYCEPAIGKKINIHALRHSRATYLLEVEKIPLERISQLLGHSDIKTTMIYAKMNPEKTINMMRGVKAI